MPKNKKLMKELKNEYGSKKGENVYYGMEQKGKVYPEGSKNKSKPPIKPKHGKKGH